MIRWLNEGRGDSRERAVDAHPDHELRATESGQAATWLNARDLNEIILERLYNRKSEGSAAELRGQLERLIGALPTAAPLAKAAGQKLVIETEPGLEILGDVLTASSSGRRPAVLVVHSGKTVPPVARRLADMGNIVLAITPRGLPLKAETRPLIGDPVSFHRAMLIGRNPPAMRAFDILRAFDLLASRADVDPARIAATASGTACIWLLMAAAIESRFAKLWLDRTPASFRTAMESPVHRNLHDAIIPGFFCAGIFRTSRNWQARRRSSGQIRQLDRSSGDGFRPVRLSYV